MSFEENLRTLRLARGLTQPVLADKAGIEQSYLSKLENGRSKPSEEVLERLAEALEVTPEALQQNGDETEERRRRWTRVGFSAAAAVALVTMFLLGRATAVYPLSFGEVVKGARAEENLVLGVRDLAPMGVEVINVSSNGPDGKHLNISGKVTNYATLDAYMKDIKGKFGGTFWGIQLDPLDPANPNNAHHFNLIYDQIAGKP